MNGSTGYSSSRKESPGLITSFVTAQEGIINGSLRIKPSTEFQRSRDGGVPHELFEVRETSHSDYACAYSDPIYIGHFVGYKTAMIHKVKLMFYGNIIYALQFTDISNVDVRRQEFCSSLLNIEGFMKQVLSLLLATLVSQ